MPTGMGFNGGNGTAKVFDDRGVTILGRDTDISKGSTLDVRVGDDDNDLRQTTFGHKKGDCVLAYDVHGNLLSPGIIIGLEESSRALVLQRPRAYRLTDKGVRYGPHVETVAIASGITARVDSSDRGALDCLMPIYPLADHIGNDLVLNSSDGCIIGRVKSVFPEYTFISPYVLDPDEALKYFRLIRNTPMPVKGADTGFYPLPVSLDDYVRTKNEELLLGIESKLSQLSPHNSKKSTRVKALKLMDQFGTNNVLFPKKFRR